MGNGFAGHAEDDAGALVLHQVVAAGIAHLAHGGGAIGPHAGEHDAVGIAPGAGGHGLEQHFHRGLVAVDGRRIIDHGHIVGTAARDGEMLAARGDIGMAGQQTLAVRGLLDRHLAQTVEPRRKTGGEARWHVLGDDDGRAVGRQMREHLTNRFRPPGGGSDGDDFFGRDAPQQAGCRRRAGRSRLGARTRCRSHAVRHHRQAVHLGHSSHADLVHDLAGQLLQAVGHADAGLGHKVDGTQLQGAHGDFGTAFGQGGDHHHRHGTQAHEPPEEINAVHAGHFHIQRDDVGVQIADHFACDQRVIGRADALHVMLAIDDLGQKTAHQRRVVHHDHPDFWL